MLNWFKRQFVPTEINGFRPLFLRRESAIKLAGIIVILELALFILPTLYFPQYARDLNLSSVLPSVLADLANKERLKNNLPILTVNEKLTQAAKLKAEDMARSGYFAHNSPESKTPWYWFNLVDYAYAFAGENLAVNFSDSEEVTQAWVNSPSHQKNLVGRQYTEMGTGIASGMYKGRETVFVVQLYGAPKPNLQLTTNNLQLSSEQQQNPIRGGAEVVRGAISEEKVGRSDFAVAEESGPVPVRVLGESAPETPSEAPNTIKRFVSSPKETTNTVLFLALAVVLMALFLNIAIKFEYQFPDLMANGALVALVIIGFHLGNNYLTAERLETSFTEVVAPETVILLR